VRCRLKRRQRDWWVGRWSFEKPKEQDADSIPRGGRPHGNPVKREWMDRSWVVGEPAPAEKQQAGEPGDLLDVLASRARPVRKGHKPNGGGERSGEVGLCRSTGEPVEQRRATFYGGWGGKGADSGEHRSIPHAPDTERETYVPGLARCAASRNRKEAGKVYRVASPGER
jgi:hypothetical protein